ncbi:tRNA pseudouridine synthase A [Amphibalanus amphitrite]|uniref:Pseudouridylate synthase 1 homolog n=1 Tax=Amphibalanus amphitrite TaxID=1232801 RepID=A0A6A4VCQ6_AMPAM|nr:tRNA pseudouridine synthase A [Amphibalanus amphitrite]
MRFLTGWRGIVHRVFLNTRVTAKMSAAAATNGAKRAAAEADEASAKKSRVDGGGGADVAPQPAGAEVPSAERWKLKKVLLLISYSGKGYLGMQRNPGCRTIEEDLLQALFKARAIPEHGLREQQSVWFQRAARTDKGVSAVKQCVSLKMAADTEGILEAINSHLPDQIRVFDMRRVTKRFDAKQQCCARTYQYMSPTFAFAPLEAVVSEQYRMSDEVLENVNRLLKKFEGTHNYHNFTSRRQPTDPSSKRFIMSMTCGKPFVRDGIEFVVIKVKGQSFMLHQIRKMIGTAMAVARGHAAEGVFERAWSLDRIDLPMAPALGLMLHEVSRQRLTPPSHLRGS